MWKFEKLGHLLCYFFCVVCHINKLWTKNHLQRCNWCKCGILPCLQARTREDDSSYSYLNWVAFFLRSEENTYTLDTIEFHSISSSFVNSMRTYLIFPKSNPCAPYSFGLYKSCCKFTNYIDVNIFSSIYYIIKFLQTQYITQETRSKIKTNSTWIVLMILTYGPIRTRGTMHMICSFLL
jgi:hypothetical protein